MPPIKQSQDLFLNQLESYLNIVVPLRPDIYNNKDVATLKNNLTQGVCSGITALWLYYKNQKKEKYFYDSIMQPIFAWDGKKETLSKQLEDLMEYALSSSVWLQASSELFKEAGMVAYPETKYERPVEQSDYDILLGSIKQKEDPTLHKEYEIAFVFKNEELKEFLTNNIGTDQLVRLGSSSHAIGLVYDGATQEYILFDSNGFRDAITGERFFEKRFASDKTEDLINNIQSAFRYKVGSPVTGLTISIFNDNKKPTPPYLDRVTVIQKILEERKKNENTTDIDQTSDYDDSTALFFAANEGHIDTFKFLLEQGAKVDQPNKQGQRVIDCVVLKGNLDILELLLDSIGDPIVVKTLINKPMRDGRTLFEAAARNGHLEVLKYLLEKKGDVQDKDMSKALYAAAQGGHVKVVEWLLEQGVKVDAKIAMNAFYFSSSPFEEALGNGHQNVAQYLLNSAQGQILINEPTTLKLIVKKGNFEMLQWFLEKKGNTPEDMTKALYEAASGRNVKIVKWLLEQGAIVDGPTLFMASQNENLDILTMLLDSPTGQGLINEPVYSNSPALTFAAGNGRLENVKLLLNRGAVLNLGTYNPIQAAAGSDNVEVMEVLLNFATEKGEKELIDMPNSNGETPLLLAVQSKNEKMVELLLNRGAKIDISESLSNPMLYAYTQKSEPIFNLFIKALQSAKENISEPINKQPVEPMISQAEKAHRLARKQEKAQDLAREQSPGYQDRIHILTGYMSNLQNSKIHTRKLIFRSNTFEKLSIVSSVIDKMKTTDPSDLTQLNQLKTEVEKAIKDNMKATGAKLWNRGGDLNKHLKNTLKMINENINSLENGVGKGAGFSPQS